MTHSKYSININSYCYYAKKIKKEEVSRRWEEISDIGDRTQDKEAESREKVKDLAEC